MNIIDLKDKSKLDDFLKKNGASALQSWEWGEFQKSVGNKIWRLGVEENGELVLSALVIKMELPWGKNYLYVPRGPTIRNSKSQIPNTKQIPNHKSQIAGFLEKLKEIVKKEKAMFLRIDPEWQENEDSIKILKGLNFVKAKKEVQPKDTWILDLNKDEEELLKVMHSKTRYNIRLAKRKGVKINRYSKVEESLFERFWQVMEKTAGRDKFALHSKEYYRKQLEVLGRQDLVNLFLAELNGNIVGGILVSFFGGQVVYMHGASDYEYRKYMAPNLLQWEAILEAKKRGCKTYDFWGVKPENKVENMSKDGDAWEGVSRFKRGFGGREVNYIGAWDLVYKRKWYGLYNLAGKMRK